MFISEPTAAFVSRREDLGKYQNIAVFDWGGGTLDVSVLNVKDNIIREVATNGMDTAGDAIDKKLAERVCIKAFKSGSLNVQFDSLSKKEQFDLIRMCETAKISLSSEDIAIISSAKLKIREKIDYEYFSLLIEEEVKAAVECLLNAISEAGLNKETIDCILCVGGSSKLRPLQEELLRYFKRDQLFFPRKVMWDIATGAAQIAYKPGAYTLSRPIGIMQSNNRFYPLLKSGQRIPTEEKTVKFGVVETTKEARFVMTDGESKNTQSFTDYFPVKLRGMDDEVLIVSCYVDADMVFKMKIRSNRMPDDFFRVWTYSDLKVCYELDTPDVVVKE